MKQLLWICGVAVLLAAAGCGSENNQDDAYDTSGVDTGYMNMDTTGVADTAGRDSMYRNSPARSDGSNSSARDRNQQ